MKKYPRFNNQTGCNKIDIFARLLTSKNSIYIASTDQSKICKEAIAKYIEKNKEFCKDKKITAYFDKNR